MKTATYAPELAPQFDLALLPLVRFAPFVLLATGLLITSVDSYAQDVDNSGQSIVANWPHSGELSRGAKNSEGTDYSSYRLLPFIDSLIVDYRFEITAADRAAYDGAESGSSPGDESRDQSVSMSFGIEWIPGDGGVFNGEHLNRGEMPDGVVIESLDLLFQVLPVPYNGTSNVPVAEFFLPLDSIRLGPWPSKIFVDITNVEWDRIFKDVGSDETRQIIESGFQLTSPKIVRAVFALEAGSEGQMGYDERVPEEEPGGTVFIPDIAIWVDWSDGRDTWVPPPDAIRRGTSPRPKDVGRSGSADEGRGSREKTRGGRETGDGSTTTGLDESEESESDSFLDMMRGEGGNSDDDDDDDNSLYIAAIAGVVAVGAVAILGGTIGYYGGPATPIGLSSGYVNRRGGVLLQVAFNEQVFGKKEGSETLIAGVTGFYNVFNSPIQPAIGLGALMTEEGTDGVRWKTNVSVGLAANLGRFVLLGQYDVSEGDFRFGAAVNLRHKN